MKSVMDMHISKAKDGQMVDRYTLPLCFELAGKVLTLDMDGGAVVELKFIDEKTAAWRDGEDPMQTARYKCLKVHGALYFVTLEPGNKAPRVCITFVLDTQLGLVTRITASEDSLWGRGIITGIKFGTIRVDGRSAPGVRHAFTDELVGNVVQWTSGPERTCVYDYTSTDACRVACGSSPYAPEIMGQRIYQEIPAAYIRLKDGFYLQLLTERIAERALALCFLQDYNRMAAVGYAFGPLPSDGDESGLVQFAAYGKIVAR